MLNIFCAIYFDHDTVMVILVAKDEYCSLDNYMVLITHTLFTPNKIVSFDQVPLEQMNGTHCY